MRAQPSEAQAVTGGVLLEADEAEVVEQDGGDEARR